MFRKAGQIKLGDRVVKTTSRWVFIAAVIFFQFVTNAIGTFNSEIEVNKHKLATVDEYEHLKDLVPIEHHSLIDAFIYAVASGKDSFYKFSVWLDENPNDIICAALITPDGVAYSLVEEDDGDFELVVDECYFSATELDQAFPPGEYTLAIMLADQTVETLTTVMPDYNSASFPDYVEGSISAEIGQHLLLHWTTVEGVGEYEVSVDSIGSTWNELYYSGNIYVTHPNTVDTTIVGAYGGQHDYHIGIQAEIDVTEGEFRVEFNSCRGWFVFRKPHIDLSGEYWFGSLSADANSWVPWGKQGTVIINGNNWYQEWDDYDGHHSFSGTFTTSVQPDGSININHAWGSYNVAWNGNIMVQADTAPDAENHLGFEIIARKATNVDVNDVIGQYAGFMHWLGWNERYAGVQWGDFEIFADGTWIYDGIDHNNAPHHHNGTWQVDDVNSVLLATKEDGEHGQFLLCNNGIIFRVEAAPGPLDESIEYDILIKRSNEPITPDDIAGTYVVRFLETSVFGQPFTCGKGTAIFTVDGTFRVDAYYSNGEHDVFDANYTVGPGNKFQITAHGDVDEGIVSPDLGLIFLPEYTVRPIPTFDDWIGGIFLVRTASNIADLNVDRWVNFVDYAAFADQWLKAEPGLSANFNRDSQVDWLDLKTFAENWLWDADWYIP